MYLFNQSAIIVPRINLICNDTATVQSYNNAGLLNRSGWDWESDLWKLGSH